MKIRWTKDRRDLFRKINAELPDGYRSGVEKINGTLYYVIERAEECAPAYGVLALLSEYGF